MLVGAPALQGLVLCHRSPRSQTKGELSDLPRHRNLTHRGVSTLEEGRLPGEHTMQQRPSKPQRAGSSAGSNATGAGQSAGVPREGKQPSTINNSTSHQSYAAAIACCQVLTYRHQYNLHSYL